MKLPLFPTLLVAAACATMVGLGVWQLQRANWKDGLLQDYAKVQSLPAIAYPQPPWPDKLPLFRKSDLICLEVAGWSATAGRNVRGQSGWVHLAQCRLGAEGPGAIVNVGWSSKPQSPTWRGGKVTGVIGADGQQLIRLISDRPLAPGLQQSAPPSIEEIPNNHFGYAVQWFLFAGVAALIYALALRRRAAG